MHAGGVLIAPGKLTEFCPLYVPPNADAILSQFDKDDVEAVGLVKFDFLGLTTLTILDWTVRYVRMLDPQASIDLKALPLDDQMAFAIFKNGNTTAVFQFESRGMRELLKQAPVNRFEDIIALVALYRPGPMELIPDYVARKSGRERFAYPDARLEPILAPTYGVMVYQEQVMQIAQQIGGYTLAAADLLRKAMGKKLPEEMAKHRTTFVEGATANGVAPAKATMLFDLMEKFAGYGFNKSHAAAYALVAYQTAWFKARYPSAFLAANLSLVMDDTDKVRSLRDDAIEQGSRCCRRHQRVQLSGRARRCEADPLRPGRRQGHRRSRDRSRRRRAPAGGAFRDLFDFCRRVDKRAVNRRAVEALIRAGAFDAIEPRRAALLASVGISLKPPSAPKRMSRKCRCSGMRRRNPRSVSSRRAIGPMPNACSTRRARSGITCPGIRSPAMPRSWRRSCARPLQASRRDRTGCSSPAS